MSFYKVCPYCGANLDPGEKCDCQDKEEPVKRSFKINNMAKNWRLKKPVKPVRKTKFISKFQYDFHYGFVNRKG